MKEKNFCDLEETLEVFNIKIKKLFTISVNLNINLLEKIILLKKKYKKNKKLLFKHLTPWKIVQISRHNLRPRTINYINEIFTTFEEFHGDRCFFDDNSIIAGIGKINNTSVAIIGHNKGNDLKSNIKNNFGMPHPEGYRKALKLFNFASKFSLPIISFIDTPGAYPGLEAEKRGQSYAISRNLFEMANLKVPIICVIIGEGCSGGAIGIGIGDKILMLEYSYFSVISPEGCSSILWKNLTNVSEVANFMNLNASKLFELGIIDNVIKESQYGSHNNHDFIFKAVKKYLLKYLKMLSFFSEKELLEIRYNKFMLMGLRNINYK